MAEAQTAAAPAAATKKEDPKVETVKMEDGTSCDFAGKRKLVKESFVQDGKVGVTLKFRNGRVLTFIIPDALLMKFAGHGAEQKLGDETAGEDDVDDAVLAVEKLIERLNKGEWAQTREGGGMSGTSILAQALAKMKNLPIDTVKAFLKDKSQAEKVALRANPAVAKVVQEIEAAKVSKGTKVDTDKLLSGLDGLGGAGGEPAVASAAPAAKAKK